MKKQFFSILLLLLLSIGLVYAQQRPTWISTPPQSDGIVEYFVGISLEQEHDEKIAQEHATQDALVKLSQYLGVYINTNVKEEYFFAGLESDSFDYQVKSKDITTFVSEAKVTKLTLVEWYKELTTNSDGTAYKGYGLFSIPLSEIKKYGDEILAEDISEELAPRLFAAINTFTGAAQVYDALITDLQKNQTLRTKAYYNTGSKKASLYEYTSEQLRNLLNSITIEAEPLIQVGDALAVRVKSNVVPNIGNFKCRVSVNGKNTVEYTLDTQDTFAVFETATLAKGKYTLQYELLFKDAVSGGSANINNKSGRVSFEVVPLLAYIDFVGSDLTDTEKRTLTQSVQRGIQQNRVPVQTLMAGGEFDAGNHYIFEVTVDLVSTGKQAGYDIYKYAVSLSLIQNGRNIRQSETKTVTDSARYVIIGTADKFIRENVDFFRQASVYMQDK